MDTTQKPSRYGKFSEEEVQRLKTELRLEDVVHLVNGDTGHEVLCRPVEEGEYLRFQTWAEDKSQKGIAPQKLVRLVLVRHDPRHADADEMFRKFPGLGDSFATELLRLAGMLSKSTVGKIV